MKNDGRIIAPEAVQGLISALAEKGTPGILLLALVLVVIWAPVGVIAYGFFSFLGSVKDFSEISGTQPLLAAGIAGLVLVGSLAVAGWLTHKMMTTMIPAIKAEAEAQVLMSQALGGRLVTPAGAVKYPAIDTRRAGIRTKAIMNVLLDRSKSVLGVELIRCNIFTLHDDGKLRILADFHINMRGRTPDDRELTIAIPNGFLSTGRAYKYFRPLLALKGNDGRWPYGDTYAGEEELKVEEAKAPSQLQWIASMPIPYQVEPFKLVVGVLNIDGLEGLLSTDQLRELLADLSAAAALIGVLNRRTGFLAGKYSEPAELPDSEKEQLKGYLVEPSEFDPAVCPEPSYEFVQALSTVKGLEFLSQVSPAMVADYLRDQLRS